MDKRVYLLTIITFIVGLVELIIAGILPLIATDLGVSLGEVGMLISLFSLSFAISGPVLLSLTAKIERKRLFLFVLFVFFLSNLMIVVMDGYVSLLVGRVLSAMCAALLISLCLTIASQISGEKYRARAIGIVLMGVSASLVFGIPFGLWLGNEFSWRAPFLFISILTLIIMIVVYFALGPIEAKRGLPLKEQLKALKNKKIVLVQLTSILFFAGHMSLYAYLTPFLSETMSITGNSLSLIYLIIGIVAVCGSFLGGQITDRLGAKRSIIIVLSAFIVTIILIPYLQFSLALFICALLLWNLLSWSLQPAIQSYLVSAAPETSDIQQSLNNSGVHVGMAIGSTVGGIIIDQYHVEINPLIAGGFTCIALLIILAAFKQKRK
ncbi:MFS transporter [Cytobacillus sp. FSL W7-1323]|uniref:MFS transporter n=1 Tax=unclassified Cytobacillus TaxID=2675268 RepID=UPI002AFE8727|nr:MFS transporter [Cytobacillus sp. OWB-43]MEA1854581.1 MFS transporter [Cytobacillus sp. OWB-43]